ncbi:hypothetical protein PGT21_001481 [Puccinia graminis f. sp. tritici]|uniref:Serum paraoxonase/arylesterase 2 n=2 Tax=Puccinia graminis f. sp. tritici TaxID=56615 RepID=A0A5B0QWG8_PUCGR|nr:hypothetical protein PGT21_002342 [Puccinia graminis f. sp. tritici]KAA1117255.1 hypothetical protein PGT21_001481 [Puccinia graminis f. sp. tritici]KAA1136904.1 hypothetical protein PGTUg99_008322 [Puccinia graminis f. sp. tritici]
MNIITRSLSMAALVLIGAILKPKIQEAGIFRTIANLNNGQCTRIDGLEACEDIFVDQPTGLAYLACSRRKDRANWIPAMNVLNHRKLEGRSSDYIALLDLKTLDYRPVKLTNLPEPLLENGIHVHGLDLFVDSEEPEPADSNTAEAEPESIPPRKATIFLTNHRAPRDNDDLQSAGTADSVIEVFDTIVGSDEATYRRTIQHDLIVTPNNLVAMNQNSFYVTNDHRKKKHWTRNLEMLFLDSALDSVVHCSFEESVHCISAFHGRHQFPNGIAKGPGNTIYMANSLNAHLRLLEIQPDNTLRLKEEFKVPRIIDNLYVTSAGSVFIAGIPSILKFQAILGELNKENYSLVSPSEVWKFSNKTDITEAESSPSQRLGLERVFADDGQQVSCTTGLAVWDSKLFMTGIASPYVSVCQVDPTIAN